MYNLVSEIDTPGEYVIGQFDGSYLLVVYPPGGHRSRYFHPLPSSPPLHEPTLSVSEGPVLLVQNATQVYHNPGMCLNIKSDPPSPLHSSSH